MRPMRSPRCQSAVWRILIITSLSHETRALVAVSSRAARGFFCLLRAIFLSQNDSSAELESVRDQQSGSPEPDTNSTSNDKHGRSTAMEIRHEEDHRGSSGGTGDAGGGGRGPGARRPRRLLQP